MPDNLPQLRDIHIPQEFSNFPLGYGWFVILAVCLCGWMLYKFVRYIVKKSKKRYALKLVNDISFENIQKSASAISEILRRICVYKYREALVLSSQDWIDFLQDHSKNKMDKKTADLLINAPYMPSNSKSYGIEDLQKLKKFCLSWIGENL
ncbi:MAG: DUF4381 domain-containing protein [Alphaproteobacteria bacterium]|nr:DUF4381 domain-containing protein [Alphaproteobacteria bacterium]